MGYCRLQQVTEWFTVTQLYSGLQKVNELLQLPVVTVLPAVTHVLQWLPSVTAGYQQVIE